LLLILSLQAATLASQAADPRIKECHALARSDPRQALSMSGDLRTKGGGHAALHCQGLAQAKLEQWRAAAASFEEAAREAEAARDPKHGDYLVQAGNSLLAAGEPAKARALLDAAFATGLLSPELQGEVHFDRARAAIALNQLGTARSEADAGLKLVPADPFGWYLSSALALKEGRLARAQDDIAEALRLAPEDPDLLFHAGNVAGISGELEAALGLYSKAVRVAPQSEAARKARAAIAANSPEATPAQPK
jgi:tetratricopeptide (TPR) repeat protein